ncbi:MAG: toll/interleukin-1 receptor domain-containing protein [Candidatus Aminicenantes bacterium]|nr:MAG: toll/interleukin-1 receptor domain-containing protein [Candidatus Aminicenantes bacterium]
MSYCVWEYDNWDTLIYAIKQNKCILMLGPDAAAVEVEGKKRMLTEILADELAEKIDPETRKKFSTSDLAQVAQYYYDNRGGRGPLQTRVSKFYEARKILCSKLHQNLAALPFYFTVTTAHDNMFPEALKKEGKVPKIEWYNFRGHNERIVKAMGTVDQPLVFYLYGIVDEPESLLITEDDLLDFLVTLIRKGTLQRNILNELQDENKNFLFLGFGFRHWHLRILLHLLTDRERKSCSYAMEQSTPVKTDPHQLFQTILFFQRSGSKIHIFNKKLDDFAAQLREKFGQISPTSKPVKPIDMPEVFICYTSEDKDFADLLHKEFKAAGLISCPDKEDLGDRDDGNRKIKEIPDNVHYIVVIQSKALAEKYKGYVIRDIQEINDAIEKKEFRQGQRFIIPFRIDKTPLSPELAAVGYVELMDKSNIPQLIKTIIRDFKKIKREGTYEYEQ